jgi:hypothetical protein
MLVGYHEVPRDKFSQVMTGDHIRYEGVDGKFRSGGFIWFIRKAKDNRMFWVVGQTHNPPEGDFSSVIHFPLYWNKANRLWKKTSSDILILGEAIDNKTEGIEFIARFLLYKYGTEFSDFVNELHRIRRNKVAATSSSNQMQST